jgi:diacylglycerol kinase family enzyme
MVANCGEIPMFTLSTEAKIDDDLLDIVIVDTNLGLLGWLILLARILLTRGKDINLLTNISSVKRYQAKSAVITIQNPVLTQSDGELLGTHKKLHARALHNAINLLVPTCKMASRGA